MNTIKCLDTKRTQPNRAQPSFEDDISKMDKIIMSSFRSVKGRNQKSSRCDPSKGLNEKSADSKERLRDRKKGKEQEESREAYLKRERKFQQETRIKNQVKREGGSVIVTSQKSSCDETRKMVDMNSSCYNKDKQNPDSDLEKKLKMLFSPGPGNDHEADVVKGRHLQQRTINRHQVKNSVRLERKKDEVSIPSAPEKFLHKTKSPDSKEELQNRNKGKEQEESCEAYLKRERKFQQETRNKNQVKREEGGSVIVTSQKSSFDETRKMVDMNSSRYNKDKQKPDSDLEKKLKMLFSPGPGNDHEADVVKGRHLQQRTINRHQVKNSVRLERKEDEMSIPSASEKFLHKTKSPDSKEELQNRNKRKEQEESCEAYLKRERNFQQETRIKKSSGRLRREEGGSVIVTSQKYSCDVTRKMVDMNSSCYNKDKQNPGSDLDKKLKMLFSPGPGNDHEADVVKGRHLQQRTINRHQVKNSVRLERKEDEMSIPSASEKFLHKTKSPDSKEELQNRNERKEQEESCEAYLKRERNFQQETRIKNQVKSSGRLRREEGGSVIVTSQKYSCDVTRKMVDRNTSWCNEDKQNRDHEADVVKGYLQQGTINRHQKENSVRLERKGNETSIPSAPEKFLHKTKSTFEEELLKIDSFRILSSKRRKVNSKEEQLYSNPVRLKRGYTGETEDSFKIEKKSSCDETSKMVDMNPSCYNGDKQNPDSDLDKKSKMLFSPGPENDHKADVVKGRDLQQRTINRHQEKNSVWLERKEDEMSIPSAPEKFLHKTKSPDSKEELQNRNERKEQEESCEAYLKRERKFQQETRNKNQVKSSDQLQREEGGSAIVTSQKSSCEETRKMIDRNTSWCNEDKQNRDHKADVVKGHLQQGTINRHQKENSVRLERKGNETSVPSAHEKFLHKTKSTFEEELLKIDSFRILSTKRRKVNSQEEQLYSYPVRLKRGYTGELKNSYNGPTPRKVVEFDGEPPRKLLRINTPAKKQSIRLPTNITT